MVISLLTASRLAPIVRQAKSKKQKAKSKKQKATHTNKLWGASLYNQPPPLQCQSIYQLPLLVTLVHSPLPLSYSLQMLTVKFSMEVFLIHFYDITIQLALKPKPSIQNLDDWILKACIKAQQNGIAFVDWYNYNYNYKKITQWKSQKQKLLCVFMSVRMR